MVGSCTLMEHCQSHIPPSGSDQHVSICFERQANTSMSHPAHYQLISEVKIRRESFGGILYKYGCADRGALSFINSPRLIELLIESQKQHHGDVSAAIE